MLWWFLSFSSSRIIKNFSNNTGSLFETFMTISSMNTKSGINGILPPRTKHGISFDLQKQLIWFQKQQKEHYSALTWYQKHCTFSTKCISRMIVFWLYYFYWCRLHKNYVSIYKKMSKWWLCWLSYVLIHNYYTEPTLARQSLKTIIAKHACIVQHVISKIVTLVRLHILCW